MAQQEHESTIVKWPTQPGVPELQADERRISEQEIREELNKIQQSAIFINSERISRFLAFVVEHVLAGKPEGLKEYVIGIEVYDRRPPYHPSQDSIVRTEARRLRKKLTEYYENEGKNDPLFIYFRHGSYAPVFRLADIPVEARAAESTHQPNVPDGPGLPIAVLPFNALTEDPLSRVCANGLTREVIDAFNRTDGFRVVAQRSSSQIASQPFSIPQLAQNLGVQFLVDGTVATEEERCRVTAQLVNEDGFQIWSERFEALLETKGVFRVLERIASALVSRVRFSCGYVGTIRDQPNPVKVAVYHEILMAEALLDEGTSANVEEALTRFAKIAQMMPDDSRAHAGVAGCCCCLALSGAPESARSVGRGREAVLEALRLDSTLQAAHSWLGCLSALEWDWKQAESNLEDGLTLGGSPTYRRQLAQFLCVLGRFDEAWVLLQESGQEDPFSQRQKRASSRVLYFARRFEDLERYFEEPLAFGPPPVESRIHLALSQIRLGHCKVAKDTAHELRREAGLDPALIARVAEIFALCGESETATQVAEQWNLLSPGSPISWFRQAILLLAFGDHEAALANILKALDEREAELIWLEAEPAFDPIRQDPIFLQALERIRPERRRIRVAPAIT